MIRLFNVYYPIRTLLLLAVETMVVFTSSLLGMLLAFPEERYIVLNYQYGYLKVLVATVVVLICSHGFDLYDSARFDAKGELYFRLFLVPGLLALALASIGFFFPYLLPGNNASLIGLVILTFGLFSFVVNAIMFWLVGQLNLGLVVNGWVAALFGSVVLSIVSGLLNHFVSFGDKKS